MDGGTTAAVRFRPHPEPDGAFERPQGAPLPVSAPDWDRALELLRRINALRDSRGRRISSLVAENGFEPWWYSQDRLLRFYLVPLTQLLPLFESAGGREAVRVENAPPDLERVLQAIGGALGCLPARPAVPLPPLTGGKAVLGMLSLLSLAAFRAARRDTVLFIIDLVSPGMRRDFRFDPLYRELERGGYRYAEYAHTLSPLIAWKNFLRRRRPVFFLEAADFWARNARRAALPPAAEFPPAEGNSVEDRALRALVPTVLGWCAASVARQRMLRNALRFQRARRAVVFDDSRHNHELTAACLELGIPVLGFQHGVFNKFHAGSMAYGFSGTRRHAFDRYGVWSAQFRERLLRGSELYPPESVFVAGPLRAPEGSADIGSRRGRKEASSAGGKIRVLVVSEPLARKSEVAAYLQCLLHDPGFELCLKLRPGESAKSLADYSLPPDRVRLLQTGTVYEAFAEVDAAVGTYSTVLYEAALALVPIVWMKTTRAYGRELAEERLAEQANRPEELPAVLRKAAALPQEELRNRRERLWGAEIRNGAACLMQALRELESR